MSMKAFGIHILDWMQNCVHAFANVQYYSWAANSLINGESEVFWKFSKREGLNRRGGSKERKTSLPKMLHSNWKNYIVSLSKWCYNRKMLNRNRTGKVPSSTAYAENWKDLKIRKLNMYSIFVEQVFFCMRWNYLKIFTGSIVNWKKIKIV